MDRMMAIVNHMFAATDVEAVFSCASVNTAILLDTALLVSIFVALLALRLRGLLALRLRALLLVHHSIAV